MMYNIKNKLDINLDIFFHIFNDCLSKNKI